MNQSIHRRLLSVCLLIAFSINSVGFTPIPRNQSNNPPVPDLGVTSSTVNGLDQENIPPEGKEPSDSQIVDIAAEVNKISIELSIEPEYLAEDNYISLIWKIIGTDSIKSMEEYRLRISMQETQAILSDQPVTNFSSKTDLVLNEGCSKGCTIQVDLVNQKNVVASNTIRVQRAEIISIDKDGGKIATSSGKIEVNIGKDNLDEDLNFYFIENFHSDKMPYSPSGHPFEIIAKVNGKTEEIRQFKESFEIIYHYDEAEYGENEVDLSLVYFDENAQIWRYLSSWVDTENNLIIAQIDHLTILDTDANALDKYQLKDLNEAQVSTFTGAATYSYPITVPEGPAGLKPNLALTYSSNIVDGAAALTQSSWVGMGWNLDAGSITTSINGTANPNNDVYSLNLNGASGTLIPYKSGITSDDRTYIDYQLQNSNYWRIRRYTGRSSGSCYDHDISTWQVWDKVGNQYLFEGRAYFTNYETYNCPKLENWKWVLTKYRNISGYELSYLYDSVSIQRRNTQGYNSSDVIAMYLREIRYPNNHYRILFERVDRHDHAGDCYNEMARCRIELKRLSEILIQHNTDGDVNFDTTGLTTIRKYSLQISDGAIFPNVNFDHCDQWNNGVCTIPHPNGKTLALASITEYGKDSGALPATSFTYGDSMHLTRVTNGYGGKIEFEYEKEADNTTSKPWPYPATTGLEASDPEIHNATGGSSEGYNAWLDDYYYTIAPGGMYRISTDLEGGADGLSQVYFVFQKGSEFYQQSPMVTAAPGPAIATYSYNFKMPITTNNADINVQVRCVRYCKISNIKTGPLVTRYRVIEKKIYKDTSTAYESIFYSFTNPALNDLAHSDLSSADFNKDKVINAPYSEFRGHSLVTETTPDTITKTEFYQSDKLSGQVKNQKIYDRYHYGGINYPVTETVYTYNQVTLTPINTLLLPPCKTAIPCKDASIYWTDVSQVESRSWNNNGTGYLATRTDYNYDLVNGSPEYGLVRSTIESEILSEGQNTTATVYRSTFMNYLRQVTETQFLVGLPVTTTLCRGQGNDAAQYAPNAVCGTTQANYLSFAMNTYDASGRMSESYSLLNFISAGVAPTNNTLANRNLKADKYEYDNYGNVNKISSGAKTGDSAPVYSSYSYFCYGNYVIQASPTCTSDGYGTYLGWEKNARSQTTYYETNKDFGQPKKQIDPNNAQTLAEYDQFGRITKVAKPGDTLANPTYQIGYHDTASPYWTETFAKRSDGSLLPIKRNVYDGLGRLIQVQTPNIQGLSQVGDQFINYGYDYAGRKISESVLKFSTATGTSPILKTSTDTTPNAISSYDGLGRLILFTDHAGLNYQVSYQVDTSISRIVQVATDPKFLSTTTETDVRGNIRKVTMPDSTTMATYQYDPANRMESYTFSGLTGSIVYDQGGRKTQSVDQNMGTWSYTYDAFGNLKTQTDASGCIVTINYDELNRPTGKTFAINCPNYNRPIIFTYDETSPTNAGIGRRTAMTDYSGSTHWQYDLRGRVIREQKTIIDKYDGNKDLGTYTTLWSYYPDDSLKQVVYPNQETVKYDYDASGRAIMIGTYLSNANTGNYFSNFVFDNSGRIKELEIQNTTNLAFTYNSWTIPGGSGKVQNKKAVFGSTTVQDLSYDYDLAGNIGRIDDRVAQEGLNYAYDSLNRIDSAYVSSTVLPPTATPTATHTPTITTTPTFTSTPTHTATASPTSTIGVTATTTPTATHTPTNSPTPTVTIPPTNTPTPTVTETSVVPGVTDDFNRTDSTNLGANWTERSGNWQIYSQTLRNASTGGDAVVTYTGTYTNLEVSADVNFTSAAGSISIGSRLGSFSGGVPTTGYVAELNSSGQVYLWRIDTWAQLGYYQISGYQPTQATNLRLYTSGSTIRVDIDGVTRITATNSTFTSGAVGLWSYDATAANQHVWDDFNLVDLTQATATATPTTGPSPTATATVPPTATATPTPSETPGPSATATQASSFPVNGVLDDFNRANGSIGSNWSGQTWAYSISSQKMSIDNNGDIYWNANSFGANQEVYVTLSTVYSTADEIDLLLKSQSNTSWNTALIEVWYDPDSSKAQVWTYTTSQDWVQRGSDISVTLADGDRFGAEATSSGLVKVYKNSTLLATVDVTAWPYYASGGYIGIWTIGASGNVLDDFGGGTVPQGSAPGGSLAAWWEGIKAWISEGTIGGTPAVRDMPIHQSAQSIGSYKSLLAMKSAESQMEDESSVLSSHSSTILPALMYGTISSPNTYLANNATAFTFPTAGMTFGTYCTQKDGDGHCTATAPLATLNPNGESWTGREITATFIGQSIEVGYLREWGGGGLHIYIDGVLLAGLNEYDYGCGKPYDAECLMTWTSGTYPGGPHTLKLTGTPGWYGKVNFRYVKVMGSLDTIPPTLGASGTYGTWGNQNQTITPNCTDLNGIAEQYVSHVNGSWVASKLLTATSDVWVRCKDNNGNWNTGKFGTVYIEKTAPVMGFAGAASNIWYNANKQITPASTDAGGSGLIEHYVSTYSGGWNSTITVSTTTDIYCYARDDAGNITQGVCGHILIDKTTPASGKNPVYTPSGGTTFPGTLTITKGDDIAGGSGAKGINCSTTNNVPTTDTSASTCEQTFSQYGTLYYRTKDNAGNWSAVGSVDVITLVVGPGTALLEDVAYDPQNGKITSRVTSSGTLNYTYFTNRPSAVQTVSDGRAFEYDANGNMTTRTTGGVTQALTYDAENHLIGIQGGSVDNRYVYDGDGRRVLGVENGVVTVYVSEAFEVVLASTACVPAAMPASPMPTITGDTTYTTTAVPLSQSCVTWKSYYSGVGGSVERVEYGDTAKTDQVFTLLQDHLGGTNQVVDSSGAATQIRYGVWGEARDAVSNLPTSRLYTGQEKSNTGLYYYNARWYDSELSRFVQPDTLIPEPYNPITLDRFAYARNNPARYNDPTGHDVGCGGSDARACARMTGEFYSLNFTLGLGTKLIVNGSIDLVVTRKNTAVFFSPQVPTAATKSNLPVVTNWYLAGPEGRSEPPDDYLLYNDNQVISPQVGISVEGGGLTGRVLEEDGAEAYGGPFTYYGGSGGIPPMPFSITGEYFVSNNPYTGEKDGLIKGFGAGLSFGEPPIEIHSLVKNSTIIGKIFDTKWYYFLNPNSPLR